VSATLRVTRDPTFGIELRRGTFEVSVDGNSVAFRCCGARIWPTYVASFIVPNVAISLRRL